MALIKCPECGKEISDTVKKCPNCGYRKKPKIDKKKFIIGGTITALALVSIVVLLVFIIKGKPLTNLEQKAVDCILDYKTMLKNPESLQVHDIRWEENELVEGMIFIYLDVSGQNGFGGNNRTISRYGVKENEITYQGKSDDDDSKWEELIAEKIKESWEELSQDDSSIISVKRVMKYIDTK